MSKNEKVKRVRIRTATNGYIVEHQKGPWYKIIDEEELVFNSKRDMINWLDSKDFNG